MLYCKLYHNVVLCNNNFNDCVVSNRGSKYVRYNSPQISKYGLCLWYPMQYNAIRTVHNPPTILPWSTVNTNDDARRVLSLRFIC